jgi:hypothetical protein
MKTKGDADKLRFSGLKIKGNNWMLGSRAQKYQKKICANLRPIKNG